MTIHSHSGWTYDDSFESAVSEVVHIVTANGHPGHWRPTAFAILSSIDGLAYIVASVLDAGETVPADYIAAVCASAPDPHKAEQIILTALCEIQELYTLIADPLRHNRQMIPNYERCADRYTYDPDAPDIRGEGYQPPALMKAEEE